MHELIIDTIARGGYWGIADFSPDGRTALVIQYIQVTKSNLYALDLASGVIGESLNDDKRATSLVDRFLADLESDSASSTKESK